MIGKYQYSLWAEEKYSKLGQVKKFTHNRDSFMDTVRLEVFTSKIPDSMNMQAVSMKFKIRGLCIGH